MQRRDFIASAIAGVSGALSLPALASGVPTEFLTSPQAFLGTAFFNEQGARVLLSRIDSLNADPRLQQWALRFEGSSPLAEGVHTLRSERGEQVSLYLQPQGNVALACVTRIA